MSFNLWLASWEACISLIIADPLGGGLEGISVLFKLLYAFKRGRVRLNHRESYEPCTDQENIYFTRGMIQQGVGN